MSSKIYSKKGKKNYKEKRMLEKLEPILKKKFEKDPEFEKNFATVTNQEDLKKLYDHYTAEDVEFEEVPKQSKDEETLDDYKDFDAKNKETPKEENMSETVEENQHIDPLNRKEPNVRDYVKSGGQFGKGVEEGIPTQTEFAEPTSFAEAFEIPDLDAEQEEAEAQESAKKSNSAPSKAKAEREPLNPRFDDMSASKQKKSVKKFAKYIVEAVSTLSEKGMIWFATKDINEAKLAEYEAVHGMDLGLLITLEGDQEMTIKQFFQEQVDMAHNMFKWTPEQKKDLSEALGAVLEEKGASPTPTQELMLVSLTIIGSQAVTLLTMKAQTNSLLDQLKQMHGFNEEASESYQAPPPPQPKSQPQPQQMVYDDPPKPRNEAVKPEPNPNMEKPVEDEEIAEIQAELEEASLEQLANPDNEIATKE